MDLTVVGRVALGCSGPGLGRKKYSQRRRGGKTNGKDVNNQIKHGSAEFTAKLRSDK